MIIQRTILSLGIALMLLGCGGEDKEERHQAIAEKTKKALGDTGDESGCNGDSAKESKECSEEDSSSSSFILNALEDNDSQKGDDSALRNQLNTLIVDMEKKGSDSKNNLESLVTQVGDLLEKDSNKVAEGLENLVDSYDKQENPNSVRDELVNLVEGVENSKLKREEVEDKLLSLVGEVESKKINREEVEEKLLALVGSSSEKEKKSLEQTQLSLESLVSSAEQKGTKEAKRLASSIINDVSKNKIKILRTEDTFVEIQVKSGDSLSSLAKKYYGDATKYKMIYEANKDKIGSKNTIYPGIKLIIPKI